MAEAVFITQSFSELPAKQKQYYEAVGHKCMMCDFRLGTTDGIHIKDKKNNYYRFCMMACFTSWMVENKFKLKMVNYIVKEG